MTLSDDDKCNNAFNHFIEQEKRLEPNPFMATRILQHIESILESRNRGKIFRPFRILQPLMVAISFFLAIFIGYVVGKQGGINNNEGSKEPQTIEIVKSELFINDFMDDDKTF